MRRPTTSEPLFLVVCKVLCSCSCGLVALCSCMWACTHVAHVWGSTQPPSESLPRPHSTLGHPPQPSECPPPPHSTLGPTLLPYHQHASPPCLAGPLFLRCFPLTCSAFRRPPLPCRCEAASPTHLSPSHYMPQQPTGSTPSLHMESWGAWC